VTVSAGEHVRPGVSVEDLARLKPVFAPGGTVTAGNASGVNDAAAAVLASATSGDGRPALGRLVAYSHAGVEPRIMGMGPVPAVHKVLERAGLKVDEIDVFEVNEAFAAQALAVIRELDLPPAKVNPNGGGVSLSHPIGATGAILVVKAPTRSGGWGPCGPVWPGGG
jgi:acetyl-CoA C-acetyltransferase